ncbi:hypothetical protein MD484_g2807, partial [Candolleomyces efflorescens]
MNEPTGVSIFWDAAAKPAPGLSGFDAVEAVRSAAKPLGFVKGFKFYADIAGFDALTHRFRSEVQCAGVTIVDTASSGRLGSATKMILVDSFIHALDDPSSNILVLTNDPDICYGVSLLRLRGGCHVFILSPSDAHPSLGQFSMCGSHDNSMLLSDRQFPQTAQEPRTSSHECRASLKGPFQGPANAGELSDQDVLPTPTIRAFREQFAASSSLRTSSAAMTRGPIHPRSATVSPPSRSSSSADQVFQTPKATVEDDDDEDDYIALTPPKPKTPTSKGRFNDTPEPHSRSPSSRSDSSDFSIVPLSHPTRDDAVASSSRNRKRSSTSSNAEPSINAREPTSKVSANLGSPDGLNLLKQEAAVVTSGSGMSISVAKSEERQDLTLHIPSTVPEVKQPTPRRSTYPSFFPPPPLSPDRAPFVPTAIVPASRPATAAPSLEKLRAALTTDSKPVTPVIPKQPLGLGALLAQGQQIPKPGSAPPTMSGMKPSKTSAMESAPGSLFGPRPTVPAESQPTGSTTKPITSSCPAATTSASAVPPHFAVLVQHLKALRDKGQNSIDRSTLGTALPKLQPDVYVKAQVSHFSKPLRKYCEAAEKAGVVVFKGANTLSLHPAYYS